MTGNTLSNAGFGEPLDHHVYQMPARMAINGAMLEPARTVVEFGSNTPQQPYVPSNPAGQVVPVRDRMVANDPLIGRPIQHEPSILNRPLRRMR